MGLERFRSSLAALRAYFYCGWAFLVPYLLSYLVYWAFALPANASNLVGVGGAIEATWFPPLLHVYWGLHLAHGLLAGVALYSWCIEASAILPPALSATSDRAARFARTLVRILGRPATISVLLPWSAIVLLFLIPGVYLEWPSDPWEHLRRITEWQTHANVTAHSAGYKAFYFLPYSIAGWLPPRFVCGGLHWYYVGSCLLVTWQYYLLAKSTGLDRGWAVVFVVVNAVFLGNNCFSFYRYYGLSSTVFAQLGAVALVRMTLSWVGTKYQPDESPSFRLRLNPYGSRIEESKQHWDQRSWTRLATTSLVLERHHGRLKSRRIWLLVHRSICGGLLCGLIAASHVQGLGIAALGVASVMAWRLVEWKRWTILALVLAALIASAATIAWWPRHANVDGIFRSQGWLNVAYGFALLSPDSPACDRMIQILGSFGLLNAVAAIVLLMRNRVVGWLTLSPLLSLSLPIFAIPIANLLATRDLIVYHRILLAIPSGLAVVSCAQWCAEYISTRGASQRSRRSFGLAAAVVALAVVVSLSPSFPTYNRLWHLVARMPADHRLRHVTGILRSTSIHEDDSVPRRLVAPGAIAFTLNALAPKIFAPSRRTIGSIPSNEFDDLTALARSAGLRLHREPTIGSLTPDPLAADPSAWITLAGTEPDFARVEDFCLSTTAVQNQPGTLVYAFTRDLISIEPSGRYHLEMSIRSLTPAGAKCYLAVAWYNKEGRLLVSSEPQPAGAGRPQGWINDSYSYFGLAGTPSPRVWTTFRTSFGPAERASIPPHARAVRLGALLNYDRLPSAVVQLTNVRLWAKSRNDIAANGVFLCEENTLVVAPMGTLLWSTASQAAQLSAHWPPNQLSMDFAAAPELSDAARRAGTEPDSSVFEFRKSK